MPAGRNKKQTKRHEAGMSARLRLLRACRLRVSRNQFHRLPTAAASQNSQRDQSNNSNGNTATKRCWVRPSLQRPASPITAPHFGLNKETK